MSTLKRVITAIIHKIGGEEPYSTVSALAYLAAGAGVALIYPGLRGLVVAASFAGLFVGTALFHFHHSASHDDADHAGMASAFAALLVYLTGLPALFILLAAVAAPLLLVFTRKFRVNDQVLMALLVAGAFGIAYRGGNYILLVLSIAFFGLGFYLWHKPAASGKAIASNGKYSLTGDRYHAYWHLLTAAGMFFLALAR